MDTANNEPETLESMAIIVRRIVSVELNRIDVEVANSGMLSILDLEKMTKLALVMQRMRVPAAKDDPNAGAEALTNEQLMKRSA